MRIRELATISFIISLLILLFGATHVDDRLTSLNEILNPRVIESAKPIAAEQERRPPDQTFLTFPEWFLVFSPAEYATFVKDHAPSEFPFFGHIAQFWQSYRSCLHAILGKYPVNYGYNVMIMVIGTSTTVEYTLRGAYEAFVGRFTDLTCGGCRTQEDDYGAKVAQDYVDFIRIQPWYEFDFATKLRGLWADTNLFGPHLLRKWERRYILTSDYSVKAVYGWLIKKATKAAYDEPIPMTSVVMSNYPANIGAKLSDVKVLSNNTDGSLLIAVPRYQPFTKNMIPLAEGGAVFTEIAGNRDDILVSVIAPASWRPQSPAYDVLFSQPILTDSAHIRVALTTKVHNLNALLKSFSQSPYNIEHIFDY